MKNIMNLKNSRRHMVTAVCLAVGLVVLTTSAFASLDNVSGYTRYKESVKNLLFYTDNVSLEASMEFIVDGDIIEKAETGMKVNEDGRNDWEITYGVDGEVDYSSYTFRDGRDFYRYYPEDNSYYTYKSEADSYSVLSAGNLIGMDTDDKTLNKAIRFFELGADLLVGDLKNNVVVIAEEDGIKEYAVNVTSRQMPEIVNAGLALAFTANGSSGYERNYVTYEDWITTNRVYMIDAIGVEAYELWNNGTEDALAEAGYDSWDAFYEDMGDDIDEVQTQFDMKYHDLFNDEYNGKGVLYVKADGSTEYYETYLDYMYAHGNIYNDWNYLFGEDPYIDNAMMTVKLNNNNELLENYFEGTLVGVDRNGDKHEATIKLSLKAYDYGTTEYDKFDPTGKYDRDSQEWKDYQSSLYDEPQPVVDQVFTEEVTVEEVTSFPTDTVDSPVPEESTEEKGTVTSI